MRKMMSQMNKLHGFIIIYLCIYYIAARRKNCYNNLVG